jgi:hypothetical protein
MRIWRGKKNKRKTKPSDYDGRDMADKNGQEVSSNQLLFCSAEEWLYEDMPTNAMRTSVFVSWMFASSTDLSNKK